MFHTLWVMPVILVVVGGLTWERVGPSGLAGLGFICLGVLMQITLARVFAKLRFTSLDCSSVSVCSLAWSAAET